MTGPIERSAWHDNQRFVAVCLVVIGHWGVGRGVFPTVSNAASDSIYLFHMPLFVMLSGRFTKPAQDVKATFAKSWGQLALPYLMFATLDGALMSVLTGASRPSDVGLLPYGLWYLVSLIWWRLIATTVGRSRRFDVVLGAASVLACGLSGWIPWTSWSLIRTAAFLPAFLFGMMLLPRIEPILIDRRVRLLSGFVLVAGVGVVAANSKQIDYQWFQASRTFHELNASGLWPALLKVGVLAAGMVVALAVTALVPRNRFKWATDAGRYTLYAYLLHLPVRRVLDEVLRRWGYPGWLSILVPLMAVPFVLLVSTKFVRRATEPFVEPVAFSTRWSSKPNVA